MAETIGLLGGSFNPIHYGHLAMAEAARSELSLGQVVLLPAGDPPHKSDELAPKEDRLEMVRLASAGRFPVSTLEVDRPGKTYTVDTLEALHQAQPGADIVMIIGADTLHEIIKWKNAPRVFELCRFAVFARAGSSLIDVPGASITRMRTPVPDPTATEIRRRVHRGHSLEGLTPPDVIDYIGAHRLYDPPVQMTRKAIKKRLKADLPEPRFRHVLAVADTIAGLAKRYGYPEKKAVLAGLLHDCAKGMTLDQMRQTIDTCGVHTDPMRRTCRELLHAPVSAAVARAVYGVTDPDILHAIWYHNTGCPDMTMLDKLLCLADMIEPGRKGDQSLQTLRRLAQEDLDLAVREMLARKLSILVQNSRAIHPDTAASLTSMERALQIQHKEEETV